MKNNFWILAVIAAFFTACGPDAPEVKNPAPVGEPAVADSASQPLQHLETVAVGESDVHGQVKQLMGILQEELNKASGVVAGVGNVTVLLDENLNLILRNDQSGQVEETKANVKFLNADLSTLQIFPEGTAGPHPGFRLAVLKGKPGVEISKGGKVAKQDHLELFLADRSGVERVLSALRQAIEIAQAAK